VGAQSNRTKQTPRHGRSRILGAVKRAALCARCYLRCLEGRQQTSNHQLCQRRAKRVTQHYNRMPVMLGIAFFDWMRATADHAAEMMNMLATSTRGKWERGRQQEEQPTRADGSRGAPGSSLPRRLPPAAGVRSELEGSSTTKRSYPDGESRFPLVGQPKSNQMQAPRTFFWVGCMVRMRERKS